MLEMCTKLSHFLKNLQTHWKNKHSRRFGGLKTLNPFKNHGKTSICAIAAVSTISKPLQIADPQIVENHWKLKQIAHFTTSIIGNVAKTMGKQGKT